MSLKWQSSALPTELHPQKGVPERIQTSDLQLRRLVSYSARRREQRSGKNSRSTAMRKPKPTFVILRDLQRDAHKRRRDPDAYLATRIHQAANEFLSSIPEDPDNPTLSGSFTPERLSDAFSLVHRWDLAVPLLLLSPKDWPLFQANLQEHLLETCPGLSAQGISASLWGAYIVCNLEVPPGTIFCVALLGDRRRRKINARFANHRFSIVQASPSK